MLAQLLWTQILLVGANERKKKTLDLVNHLRSEMTDLPWPGAGTKGGEKCLFLVQSTRYVQ